MVGFSILNVKKFVIPGDDDSLALTRLNPFCFFQDQTAFCSDRMRYAKERA